MNESKLAEVAGWYGIIAILGAYFLVSFGVINSDALVFQILNLTGALGVIWISVVKKLRQTVVLNVIWAVIALTALWRILL